MTLILLNNYSDCICLVWRWYKNVTRGQLFKELTQHMVFGTLTINKKTGCDFSQRRVAQKRYKCNDSYVYSTLKESDKIKSCKYLFLSVSCA